MATLPRPAPKDPLPLAARWLAEAEPAVDKNPWAMALATATAEGRPSVRYVLLKSLSSEDRHIVFYTNYGSRKAAELEATGFGAGVLYWPALGRQLRFEGAVERSPAAESDAYFVTRPRMSQLNARVSRQSRPIESPDALLSRSDAENERLADQDAIERPPGWGGYRLKIDAIEFWSEGGDRFHERLRFEWQDAGGWSSSWLQP